MIARMNLICVALLSLSNTEAFAAFSTVPLQRTSRALFATGIHRGKDDGQSILEKARTIAFGNDDLSTLDAEIYLNEVLDMERECSSGDRMDAVCEIVLDYSMEEVRLPASIVALKH